MSAGYDNVHQRIVLSFQNMKNSNKTTVQLEQAATNYYNKLAEAGAAAGVFYTAVDNVATRATDSSAEMSKLGHGLRAMTACARTLHEMQQEHLRALREYIIDPLQSNTDSDKRNLELMEKEYLKFTKQYLQEQRRAEVSLDKVSKKASRTFGNPQIGAQLRQQQQVVADRVADLEALRWHSLRSVLTEERRRYVNVLGGICDMMKVSRAYGRESLTPINTALLACEPLCQDPNRLPPDFNPFEKRGGNMMLQAGPVAGGATDGFGFGGGPPGRPSMAMGGRMGGGLRGPNLGGRNPGLVAGGGGGMRSQMAGGMFGQRGPPVGPMTAMRAGQAPGMSGMPPQMQQQMQQQQMQQQQQMDTRSFANVRPSSAQVAAPVPRDAMSLPPVNTRAGPAVLPANHHKALHDYTPTEDGQIAMNKGDVIDVESVEDDWAFGKNTRTAESGWIPASFIDGIPG